MFISEDVDCVEVVQDNGDVCDEGLAVVEGLLGDVADAFL